MNKLIGATLLVCSIALPYGRVGAQSPKAFEKAANKAMEAKDYYAAMQYFGKVLEMEPTRIDVSYRYADVARQFGAYGQAEILFRQVLDADQNGQFPDAPCRLAQVKKILGKYDEAIRLYRQFTATACTCSPLRQEAEKDIEECLWALQRRAVPDPGIFVERLPAETPNTGQSEFAATIQGATLIYSSFREMEWGDKHYPERPIVKVMESRDGTAAVPASFNDPKRHTANATFSPDGKVLIFNKCDYVTVGGISCELYFASATATGWSDPVRLPDAVNTPGFTTTQAHIRQTEAGNYELFYVSDRPGGRGGLDIWTVFFSETGNFGHPENLATLNTLGNEVTPFFDEREKALYFSSNGLPSTGGYDIYRAARKDRNWETPLHQDMPLNSSYDDLYFALQDDSTALFSSNREASAPLGDEACCYDIFKATYLPVDLKTLAFTRPDGEPLTGVVFSLTPDETPDVAKFSGEQNEAIFPLQRREQYRVIANKEFHTPDTVYFSTHTMPEDRRFVEKLYLTPEIGLAVKTFHEWTKEPLFDVLIRIYEQPGRVAREKSTGAHSNESEMSVGGIRMFTVVAEKSGYSQDTVVVTAEELKSIKAGTTLYKSLFLSPASMSAYLPIALFFDNDRPDPRTRSTHTTQTYDQAVAHYLDGRDAFIEKYTARLVGAEKESAKAQLGKFFDEEVRGGYINLEAFAGNLELFLKGGSKIEIMVKAFASPLASSDYNLALTQRRIASVRNYFRKFGNGIFEEYVRNGQLKVSTLPLGESAATPGISDDARDKRSSVFSIEASRERRAEIIEVRMFKN